MFKIDMPSSSFNAWIAPDDGSYYIVQSPQTHQQWAFERGYGHIDDILQDGWIRLGFSPNGFSIVEVWDFRKSIKLLQKVMLPLYEQYQSVSVWVEDHQDPNFDEKMTLAMLALGTLEDIYGKPQQNPPKLESKVSGLKKNLESEFEGLDLNLTLWKDVITIERIVVAERGRGIGTQVMQRICDFSDAYDLRIALTPTSDFGGSKRRLKEFYRRFGFRNYNGYEFRETMVRDPNNEKQND